MMTEGEVISWFARLGIEQRAGTGSFIYVNSEPLYYAYKYLNKRYKETQKQNPELSWVILEQHIGRPVFFVTDGDISNGWIILKGLHIDESGHSVLGTDGTQLYFENCKFYRMEV